MRMKETRPPGHDTGQAAGITWERISTRDTRRSRRANQPGRGLVHLALAVQAPCDVVPSIKRHLKRRLAEAILCSDDAVAERLRERLDAILNKGAGR